MQDNPLSNSEEQEKLSCLYLQPKTYHTQSTHSQYTADHNRHYSNSSINAFSCSIIINLKNKIDQDSAKPRKNAVTFSKSRRSNFFQAQELSTNSKHTPFINRKDLEKKAIQKKLIEIRNKKEISSIIQGSIKKWLVIQEIPTQTKQKHLIRSEPSQEENGQSKNKADVAFSKKAIPFNINKQDRKKEKMSLYLKRTKKQKIWKKLEKPQHESAVNLDLFSKLKVQNFTMNTTTFLKSQYSIKNNRFYTRLNSTGQRQVSINSFKMRSSSPLSQQNTKKEVELTKSQMSESALKCSKIDIKDYKCRLRPQTAVVAEKLPPSSSKKSKRTVAAKPKVHEMTGWQDLADSCQRQIYF